MKSQMALEDVYALKKRGIDVTPEEIIDLNQLGLQVEKSSSSCELFALPRCAFLGDVVFYEPTVGAEIWFQKALQRYGDDFNMILALRMLQTLMPWDKLPDPFDQSKLVKALDVVNKRLDKCTYSQVVAALDYVISGNVDEVEVEEEKQDNKDDSSENLCLHLGLVHEGQALGLGSVSDLKGMTKSALLATLDLAIAAQAKVGQNDNKAKRDKAFVKYMKYKEQIEAKKED